MLQIITNPNPILRKKSLKIKEKEILSDEIQALIPEMVETMLKKDGVGLAGPQVGKNIRIIAIRHKNGNLVIFNPQIKKRSFSKEWGEEGCLSVPGKFGNVKRNKKVTLSYLNEKAENKVMEAEGLLARIIQHEIDHLDGILFIDKAKEISEFKT